MGGEREREREHEREARERQCTDGGAGRRKTARRVSREREAPTQAAKKHKEQAGKGGKRWTAGLLEGLWRSGEQRGGGGGACWAEQAKRCKMWSSGLTAMQLLEEWEALEREAKRPQEDFHRAQPKSRNALPCVEKSRVKLKEGPQDFIHANHVETEPSRHWILTQGPMAETVGDLCQMVWHERCPAIVMLCQVKEEGRGKCVQYYPDKRGQNSKYTLPSGKELSVTADSVQKDIGFIKDQAVVLSSLKLKVAGQLHSLLHMQYTTWPAQEVPSAPDAMVPFLEKLEKQLEEQKTKKRTTGDRPVLVHCSAGIGRPLRLASGRGLGRVVGRGAGGRASSPSPPSPPSPPQSSPSTSTHSSTRSSSPAALSPTISSPFVCPSHPLPVLATPSHQFPNTKPTPQRRPPLDSPATTPSPPKPLHMHRLLEL